MKNEYSVESAESEDSVEIDSFGHGSNLNETSGKLGTWGPTGRGGVKLSKLLTNSSKC